MIVQPGTIVKVKLVRHGMPVAQATVLNMAMAVYGNIRVRLEDGQRAMAIYPVLEVLGETAK